MLEESILDFLIVIFTIVATITFAFACIKRRELLPYTGLYLFLSIGSIFVYLQVVNYTYRIIGNIFYTFATISLFLAVIYETYQLSKNKKTFSNLMSMIILIILIQSSFSLFFFSIQITMAILIIISLVLLFHIYLVKKSLAHIFIFLSGTIALISLLTTMVDSFNVNIAWEISYVTNFAFITILFTTSIVAILEEKIIKSEANYKEAFNRAEFYKNLFVHDISNIFQGIYSSTELYMNYQKKEEDKEKADKMIKNLYDQTIRGRLLISNIQKLSQITQDEKRLKPTNVMKTILEAKDSILKAFSDKSIAINISSQFDEVYIQADELIADLFENLLINAVKHNSNQNIEIKVNVNKEEIKDDKFIRIEFIDNGIGIADRKKDKIFKGSLELNGYTKGMGIGLMLAKNIVDRYKGKIWVENRIKEDYSKGSKFVLLIPEK